MKYRHFDSSIVGKDKTIIDNILRTVVDDNYTSVMITRADSGYTILGIFKLAILGLKGKNVILKLLLYFGGFASSANRH
jgi:hypothetical protein